MRDGIMVINKPKGITSHDVVSLVRKALKIKRVGHAGTLDPLATGVLIVLIGKCTKLFNYFMGMEKEYVATLRLGAKTTTGDSDGEVIENRQCGRIDQEKLKLILSSYLGETMQIPPMYSALKYKGRRLYSLAREGKCVERAARKVNIRELYLLRFDPPDIQFYLRCSKGTYVRQLAEDIAGDLQCLGFVSQIERRSIGPFSIRDSVTIEDIKEDKILSFSKEQAPFFKAII
jgi:tRNA pseudouridine55 synthase